MKVNIISFSFVRGGAAIAARKFAEILEQHGFDVQRISQDDAGVFHFILRLISHLLGFLQRRENPIKHSLNLFSYYKVLAAFKDKGVVNNLHWINNDTLGVFSFRKIPKHSIISLHDEWLYCGTEHCCSFMPTDKAVSGSSLPFVYGYTSRLIDSNGINWRKIIWQVKLKVLSPRNDLVFTVPSTWMLERAKNSLVLGGKDIRVLPNPINVNVFSPPSDNNLIRDEFGLSSCDIIITFGAVDGGKTPAKGALLLIDALGLLHGLLSESLLNSVKLVMFGGKKSNNDCKFPFPCLDIGHIQDQNKLAQIYAMSDCVIVPSYVESFGQVAAEAQACGVPVVAFNTSGLTDVVIDGQTGFLAEAFSPLSLAEKISLLLKMSPSERQELGSNARQHIVESFSYEVISRQYLSIIHEVIARNV